MNREECLDTLKNMANCWVMESIDIDEASKEADEVIAYFTELFERDTPKKKIPGSKRFYRVCAYCGKTIGYMDFYDFCKVCGQRIDWSV